MSLLLVALESCIGCLGVLYWLPWSLVLVALESCIGCLGVFYWLPWSLFLPALESFLACLSVFSSLPFSLFEPAFQSVRACLSVCSSLPLCQIIRYCIPLYPVLVSYSTIAVTLHVIIVLHYYYIDYMLIFYLIYTSIILDMDYQYSIMYYIFVVKI